MPNYTFEDIETGEVFVQFMKMDEKETFLKENPNLKFVFTPIALPGDHIMGVGPNKGRETDHFKERMSRIAETHPNSPLADKYGSRTHKQVKIRDSVKRVKKKLNME
tara:strand:- start:94 stop:414 length:321 start_codon:yes stop_codon:yes gene_type:complete